MGFSGISGNRFPPGTAHLTSDRRFVASCLLDNTSVLYDLRERREVMRFGESGWPHFSSDDQLLVFIPFGNLGGKQPSRYRFDGRAWNREARCEETFADGEHVLGFAADCYVTGLNEFAFDPTEGGHWLQHAPKLARSAIQWFLQQDRVRFRLWAIEDGQLLREFLVPLSIRSSRLHDIRAMDWSLVTGVEWKLASTGLYVAVIDDTGLSVWKTARTRPLSCWLTCSALALLAVWVGWPRRGGIIAATT